MAEKFFVTPDEIKELLIHFFSTRRAFGIRFSKLFDWILEEQQSNPSFDVLNWLKGLGYSMNDYKKLMSSLDRYLSYKESTMMEKLSVEEKKTLKRRAISKTTELAGIKHEVADKFVDEIIPIASQLGYEISTTGILSFCRFLKDFYEENREKIEEYDDAIALIKVLAEAFNPYFIRIVGQKVLSDTIIKFAMLRANGLKIPYDYEKYVLEELRNKIYDIVHEAEMKMSGE